MRTTSDLAVLLTLACLISLPWSAPLVAEPRRAPATCQRWKVTRHKVSTTSSSTVPVVDTYGGAEPFAAELVTGVGAVGGGETWLVLTRLCVDEK